MNEVQMRKIMFNRTRVLIKQRPFQIQLEQRLKELVVIEEDKILKKHNISGDLMSEFLVECLELFFIDTKREKV